MGFFKKKEKAAPSGKFDRENEKSIIKASICNGEQIAGFKNIHTGKMREIMLIKTSADLWRCCFMQKNKKRAYPAFIREDGGMQLVYVPDFAIFTEGHDLVDAIEMARDAIGMAGKAYEEDRKELPEPSDYEEAIKKAELIKSDFDYTRGYLTLVDVDFQLFDRA